MPINRTHLLIAALAGSLGLNAWVMHKALRGRDRGVLPDIVQQTRTEAREDLFTLVTIRKDAIVLLGDSHLEYFPHHDLLEGHRFVDLDSALRKDGLIDPALTFDGLHLNAKGYLRMAATLRGVLPAATRPV